MSALPDDDARLTAEAICAARQAVDEATRQLHELTSRLSDRQVELDHVETVLDAVLDVSTTPLVVVDPDRRVRALSRAAADVASVGTALAEVVPPAAARRVGELIDAGGPVETELPEAGPGASARVLPNGQVIVVLAQP